MYRNRARQKAFTLIEISIVLLIITIILGLTVGLLPKQQELKRYRTVNQTMDEIKAAIIGFAQINGRLPCPAQPNTMAVENGGGASNCGNYSGFVPVNTLGISGRLNSDALLVDPWNNPYRYYVSNSDFDGNTQHDFVWGGEMRNIGMVDSEPDDFIDLDGKFHICDSPDSTDTSTGDLCDEDDGSGKRRVIFGRETAVNPGPYGGAIFVLVSNGKNWRTAPTGDELKNRGGTNIAGTSVNYPVKNTAANETTFIKRSSGFADDFDDVVKWVGPNILFSRMIEAGQLP